MSQRSSRNQSQGSFQRNDIEIDNPMNCHNRRTQQSNLGVTKMGRTTSQFSGQSKTIYETRKGVMEDHYSRLLEKNQHFFEHLGGKCICGMCICGHCKCPKKNLEVDYKKGGVSEYQKEFQPKDNDQAKVDTTYYKMQYHNKQPMELSTTNRVDYDEKPVPHYEMQKEARFRDKFLPFAGVSAYTDTYVNYPSNPVAAIKPASHPTVIKDLPFGGKSSYANTFKGDQVPYDPEIQYMINKNKRGQFKSPLNPDFPFLDETSNGFYYQPYKTKKNPSLNNKSKYDPLPAFEGQFLSTKMADFDPKNKKKCPARVILNTMYEQDLKNSTMRSTVNKSDRKSQV